MYRNSREREASSFLEIFHPQALSPTLSLTEIALSFLFFHPGLPSSLSLGQIHIFVLLPACIPASLLPASLLVLNLSLRLSLSPSLPLSLSINIYCKYLIHSLYTLGPGPQDVIQIQSWDQTGPYPSVKTEASCAFSTHNIALYGAIDFPLSSLFFTSPRVIRWLF